MNAEPVPSPGPVRRPAPAATGNPIVPPQHTLLKSAWLAVLLGLAVEGAVLLTVAAFGGALAAKPATADLVQKLSWSVMVCVALALARTAARASAPLMSLAGLLAAPAAFAIARGLHKGAAQALGLAAVAAATAPSPLVIASFRGIEYALLGFTISWLSRKSWGGVGAHAIAGFAAGLLFGVPLVVFAVQAMPQMGGLAIATRLTNELLFPLGCALVLYASDTLGKRLGG
ncbi:MAG: hypothetical protein AB7G12_06165 [Thermoanaerobaculia bacterium]